MLRNPSGSLGELQEKSKEVKLDRRISGSCCRRMTHNPSKRHRWNCGPANRVLPGPVSHYLLPLGFQSHNTHRQSRIYLGSTFPGKTKQLFKSSKRFFYRRQIYVWQFSVGKWILWSRSLRQSYTFPERWLHWNGRRTHCSAGSLEGRRRLVVIWIAWARRGEGSFRCLEQIQPIQSTTRHLFRPGIGRSLFC